MFKSYNRKMIKIGNWMFKTTPILCHNLNRRYGIVGSFFHLGSKARVVYMLKLTHQEYGAFLVYLRIFFILIVHDINKFIFRLCNANICRWYKYLSIFFYIFAHNIYSGNINSFFELFHWRIFIEVNPKTKNIHLLKYFFTLRISLSSDLPLVHYWSTIIYHVRI